MINDLFKYQTLDAAQLELINDIKTLASEILELLESVPGRSGSISRTKLEECVMWAGKGISHGS